MKISELVKQTGVSKETIHYYIREGLLRKPRKTGRNVAQYSDDYIEQIRIIKALQDNHYLPLAVIRKILKRNRKATPAEKASFNVITEHFRPIDRLLGEKNLVGTEAFLEMTGLGEKWLLQLKEWGIITPKEEAGIVTYSSLDITLGKLIVAMDRLGYGPKDGGDPSALKKSFEFITQSLLKGNHELMDRKSEQSSFEDVMVNATQLTEVMGLYLYYLYQKTAIAEFTKYAEMAGKEK